MSEILKRRGSYNQDEIIEIITGLAESFSKMEEVGIAQCDIKPSNFILCEQKNAYKIADFGISIHIKDQNKVISGFEPCGTPAYMSPEVFKRYYQRQQLKNFNPFISDVYSLGLTICSMMGMATKQKCEIATSNRKKNNVLKKYQSKYGELVNKVLKQMLEYDCKIRIGFNKVSELFKELSLKHKTQINEEVFSKEISLQDKIKDFTTKEKILYFDNLAKLYSQNIGNYNKAQAFYEKAYEFKKELFGEDSLEIATSLYNLGELHLLQRSIIKALEFHEKALDIRLNKLNEKHKLVAYSFNSIGQIYRASRQLDKALKMFQKARDIIIALYGVNSTEVAICYTNIGEIYRQQKNYELSLSMHQQSLKINKNVRPENIETATSLNNIAQAYLVMGNLDKALEAQNESLSILIKQLGEIHPLIATAYSNIGEIYQKLSVFSKALQFHQMALQIRVNLFGNDNIITAASYFKIGCLYKTFEDLKKAAENFEQAYKIQKHKGQSEKNMLMTMEQLIDVYTILNMKERQDECKKEIERIKKNMGVQQSNQQ